MVEVEGLCAGYGPVKVLHDVSLQVARGELVCLLGPNGAGKTTVFRTICGLLRPERGRVTLAGQDVARLGPQRLAALGVGFVPEGRRLFPSLTVQENLRLGYDACPTAEPFAERIEAMAGLFPRIRERLDQPARTMSGGEQAMVALARALIGRPQILVMDEPSLGLSPKLIDEYFDIIRNIHAGGTTILLIEQNAENALSISDRGYLLIRGRVAVSGRSDDLLRDDTVRQLYL